MKRKLFTLLVAFLAIVGFQAKAQPVIAWIAAGDSTTAVTNNSLGEKWGYAGLIDKNAKLTLQGNRFVYKTWADQPVRTTSGSPDRIFVANPTVNFITFTAENGTKLELTYAGRTYDQFVVFKTAGNMEIPTPERASATPAWPQYVLTPQNFNNGHFDGFLAIQATGYPDNDNLLIVVHDRDGNLKLMSYGEYVRQEWDGNYDLSTGDGFGKGPRNYPLYIESNPLGGRWARPSDFADCKFHEFVFGTEKLTAYTAERTARLPNADQKAYSTFTVKQVDYVQDGDITATNNIITHYRGWSWGAWFQGLDYDLGGTNPWNYGTTTAADGIADVIPLFVLASPENSCKVLSVSRQNDMGIQSQQNGGYANKLEIRDYEQYWQYVLQPNGTYTYEPFSVVPSATQNNPADAWYDTYTSLQKFAIWIDIDGKFILYPAASYSWRYGDDKRDQPDNILPNAVLIYNDIHVRQIAGSTNSHQAEKIWGVQIGWWNGIFSSGSVPGYIGTIPNDLQTWTTYETRYYNKGCLEEDKNIEGRFYFLEVYPDTTGLSGFNTAINRRTSGYQWGREYVLSTQVTGTNKQLAVVPKEIKRSTEDQYWRFPYDSVNMAAHWEIQAVKSSTGEIRGYRFINMLGDTLKYDSSTPNNLLRGGYLPINKLIPGANDMANEGKKYFGRPVHTGFAWDDVTHWFDLNPNATNVNTYDVWKIHQLKGQDSFFLELADQPTANRAVNLDMTSGWNYGPVAADQTYYYCQRDAGLTFDDLAMTTYTDYSFAACPGMLITKKEIYYVPKYGPYRGDERENNIINTNDATYFKQDSLTAYTFLEGFYAIKEAVVVNNLRLGYNTVSINDGTSARVDAAVLKPTEEKLEFIPLTGVTATNRANSIKSLWAASGMTGDDSLAWLYGETYKWYLVKLGSKYLSYDWVNRAARTNRETAGMIFTDILENAVPVRLYQPLVGDKAETNFLFQFYIPNYKYNPTATVVANRIVATNFYDSESQTLGDLRNPLVNKNEVCFATLSNQSNFIFATRAYTGLTSGTRFTIVPIQPSICPCEGEFIAQKWMGEERLLNLPLNNRIWDLGAPTTAWIATGASTGTNSNSAIVTNDGADKSTTLTHTYVTTIREYNDVTGRYVVYNEPGIHKVMIPGVEALGDTTWIGGIGGQLVGSAIMGGLSFEIDLDVPLYYVQNDAGKYLTVVPKDDMNDLRATVPDVNGVKLEWMDKIEYSRSEVYTTLGYDRRAFQLFAISGCQEDPKDGQYGQFIYLPLASYQYDYANNKIITTRFNGRDVNAIYYNEHLGKEMTGVDCPGNDLRDCWRIGYHTKVSDNIKNMVVFNANSVMTGGSLTPIQFKLSKQEYLKPDCPYYLVQSIGKGINAGKYAAFNQWIGAADDYTISAHWKINFDQKDEFLSTFVPELEKVYDVAVGSTAIPQNELNGEYYFVKKVTVDGKEGYLTIDVAGYGNDDFVAKFDTLLLTCTDHKVPFFDLEKDGHFNLLNKLAILETPFTDRNLTWIVKDVNTTPTPIYRGGQLIGYRTYIDTVGKNFNNAEYLTVWRENRRELTDNHIIPYYSFSVTRGGIDYFLNVDSYSGRDSVYWTALSNADKTKLIEWSVPGNENLFKTFKFCLPYKVEPNGSRSDEVAYGDTKYPPVYLQTLDTGINDYPFLVVAGSSTMYVTARKLDDAIKNEYQSTLEWNIYTVDYRYIDPVQVTSWIFGGQIPSGDLWVPIGGAIANGSTEGVLTNQKVDGGGVIFIDQSKETPVNFGTITGIGNAPTLTVEFEGDTLIGTWAQRPIWYYRVKLDGKYLTDATEIAKTNGNYYYSFKGDNWPYAFFGNKLPNFNAYVSEGISADEKFLQTFGFRYLTDSSDPHQRFYVVSNADYSKNPTEEDKYRFLADINTQLVFLEDSNDALVFQWGHIENGVYVDLQVVGQGGIFGVEGGIKFQNTTGKVDIYSVDGRLIKSAELTGSEQTIPAPRGIAVVKNGSKVVKVVVQ